MAARTLVTHGESETTRAGVELAADLAPGDVVLLIGDLGLGKTVLARGIATGLGVDPSDVHSPTFTLVNQYQGRIPVHHVDLYRIDRESDLGELGLEEILGGEGVAIVEWGERLGRYGVRDAVEVSFVDRGGAEREIRIVDRRHSSR